MSDVTVFVSPARASGQSQSEQFRYQKALRSAGFGAVNIVKGRDGLANQVNFIRESYPVGAHVVFLSDTVTGMRVKTPEQANVSRPAPAFAFHALVHMAWHYLQSECARFWSVNVGQNFLNMGVEISRRFGGLNGNMFGEQITRASGLVLPPNSGLVFDYELACRAWECHGVLLRFRMFCVLNKYRSKGGQNSTVPARRKALTDLALHDLAVRYPDLLAYKPGIRASGSHAMDVTTFPKGSDPIPVPCLLTKAGRQARRRSGTRGRQRIHVDARARWRAWKERQRTEGKKRARASGQHKGRQVLKRPSAAQEARPR